MLVSVQVVAEVAAEQVEADNAFPPVERSQKTA
jgi:hypothetical protein